LLSIIAGYVGIVENCSSLPPFSIIILDNYGYGMEIL
jgi:hypothetical protein